MDTQRSATIVSIYAFIVLGVFFGTTVNAQYTEENIYLNNSSTIPVEDNPNAYCFDFATGYETDCTVAPGDVNDNHDLHILQETYLPIVGDSYVDISEIWFHLDLCADFGQADLDFTGYLLNQNDYNNYLIGNSVTSARATSTNTDSDTRTCSCPTCGGHIPFEFNYTATPSDRIVAIVAESTSLVGQEHRPRFVVADPSHPAGLENFLAEGFYKKNTTFTDISQVNSDNLDWTLTIFQGDFGGLTIDAPYYGQSIYIEDTDYFTAYGSCEEDPNLVVRNSTTTESSDFEFYWTSDCINNYWELLLLDLPQDQYWLVGSTTYSNATTTFFWTSKTATTTPLEIQENIFESFDCGTDGLTSNICNFVKDSFQSFIGSIGGVFNFFYESIKNIPPYSYPITIYDAINDGINSAESMSTSTLPVFELSVVTSTINISGNLFEQGILTQVMSQSDWDTLRPTFEILIYLAFASYLYYRFIHSL